jgi:acetyltransferase-like isoleucine patch superfamily enzyme
MTILNLLKKILPISMRVNHYGTDITINGKLFLVNEGFVSLGNGIIINSSFRSNPIFNVSKSVIICKKNALIEIGDNVGISNTVIYSENKITIGKNTLLGAGVKIYDSDFHSLNHLDRRFTIKDVPKNLPVSIGSDCFIGAGSIILKGVVIGDRAIIGAGSVVTKNIDHSEIWAGNPAKRIK